MDNDPHYDGYDYGMIDNPDGTSTVTCFPSNNTRCTVVRVPKPGAAADVFYSPKNPPSFHDKALQDVTHELNAALAKVPHRNKNERLHLLSTPHGPMLAWVEMSVKSVPIEKIGK
jgi:hypothetical protein